MLETKLAQWHPVPDEHVLAQHVDLERDPLQRHDAHVPIQHELLHVFRFRENDLKPIQRGVFFHFYLADFQRAFFAVEFDSIHDSEVTLIQLDASSVHLRMRNDAHVRLRVGHRILLRHRG